MKFPLLRLLVLAFPAVATLLLTSCVSDYYRSADYDHPTETGYATYVSLPADYAGDAYYYNNRYYAGGRYEPGSYTYQGRRYDHRYFHNGQYLYGGDYRHQAAAAAADAAVSSQVVNVRTSAPVDYATYRNMPRDASDDAYYYNNRYYSGGSYEPGVYTHQGRTYDHRYLHNGQYLYGGDYRRPLTTVSNQSPVQRSAPTYRTALRRASYY